MRKILFHGFEKTNRAYGWGDVIVYNICCNIKAKELGYDNIDMVFPRFTGDNNVIQNSDILNGNFIPNNTIPDFGAYDKSIDMTKDNILFNGYKGIQHTGLFLSLYNSYYYNNTKENICIPYNRDKSEKYILFHNRSYIDSNDHMKELRNTSISELRYYFKYIKNNYPNYKLWKIGEECSLDRKFDKVINTTFDIDSFIKLIGNSSLYLGGQCGPSVFAYYIKDLPIIRYGTLKEHDWYYTNVLHKIVGDIPNIYKYPNWCDDNMLTIIKGTRVTKNELDNFLNKFIKVIT